MKLNSLILTKPDDWHVHLRDGEFLKNTLEASALHFARVLAMPNLEPPLDNLDALLQYHDRINHFQIPGQSLKTFLTFYLNEQLPAKDLQLAKNYSFILGAKFYPAGATTNSAAGARTLKILYPLLDLMQQQDLVLQIHGEVTYGDIFEREEKFINEYLIPVMQNFPKLRIVLEHISTRYAVDFISAAPDNIAATITPQHLLYNRNQLLVGGVKPHYYCLPILKHQDDQIALQQAATSGNPRFFLGTDSAPHIIEKKENACGCAGIYSAPYALQMYAGIFEQLGKLEMLNDFSSRFGAEFYHLPVNNEHIELIKSPFKVPATLKLGAFGVVPIAAGTTLDWSINDTQ